MFKIIQKLSFIISLLALGRSVDASAAPACKTDVQTRQNTAAMTKDLRIALANGDVPGMKELVENSYLGVFDSCSDAQLIKVCDFDCLTNLSEYFLFMSSDLAYYYTKASTKVIQETSSDALNAYVNDGLKLAQAGKRILEEKGVSGAPGDPSPYRNYVAHATRFDLTRAQIHMASGDNWYQSMSELRIKRLNKLVGEATDDATPGQKAGSSEMATTHYQAALWIITEALMGVPDTTDFNTIRKDLLDLEREIDRRTKSLEKGFLYVDIDPEANSLRNVSTLKSRLSEVVREIGDLEDKVEALLINWLNAKKNAEDSNIANSARKNELSISLSGYKIAQMESDAKDLSLNIDERKTALAADIELYKNKSNLAQTEYDIVTKRITNDFELNKRVKELQNRIALLDGKKEIDILDFKQAQVQRDIENLKWLMNWDIARTNIAVQLKASDIQDLQYAREKRRNSDEIAGLSSSIRANQKRIENLVKTKEQLEEDKLATIKRRDSIDASNKEAARTEICETEYRLARFGSTPGKPLEECQTSFGNAETESSSNYESQVCVLKQTQALTSIQNRQQLMVCVLGLNNMPLAIANSSEYSGVTCSNEFKSQYSELIKTINAETAISTQELANLEARSKQAEDYLKLVEDNFSKLTGNVVNQNAIAASKVIAGMVVQNQPDMQTCACGVASGAITGYRPGQIYFNIAMLAADIADRQISFETFKIENAERIAKIKDDLKDAKEQVKLENMKLQYQALSSQKVVSDFLGESFVKGSELKEFLQDKQMVDLNCNQGKFNSDTEIGVLKLKHQSQLAAYSSKNSAIDNFAHEIARITLEEGKVANEIEIIGIEQARLEAQSASIVEDNASLDRIMGISADSKNLVTEMQIRLTEQENDLKNKEQVLESLTKNKTDTFLALGDKETKQLLESINADQTQAQSLNDRLVGFQALSISEDAGLTKLLKQDTALANKLINVQKDLSVKVNAERDVIFDKLSIQVKDAEENKSQRIFIATQDQIAKMVRSVPYFIQTKRRLIEEANKVVVKLRNKADSLLSLTGKGTVSAENRSNIFVKTSEHLKRSIKDVENQFEDYDGSEIQNQIRVQTYPIKFTGAVLANLAKDGRAKFQISPALLDKGLAASGFVLGSEIFENDPNFATGNQVIIDMFFDITYENKSCIPRGQVDILHGGDGYVFRPFSKQNLDMVPVSVVSKSQWAIANAYSSNISNTKFLEQKGIWEGVVTDIVGFDKKLEKTEDSLVFPFLGRPLISSYEIVIPKTRYKESSGEMRTCEMTAADLYVVVALDRKLL